MKVKLTSKNGTVELDGVLSIQIEQPVEQLELPKQRKPRKAKTQTQQDPPLC